MLKKILSLVLAILLISISIISFAETEKDLNDKKDELEHQINQNKDKIGDIEDKVDSTMGEIDKLNAEIAQKQDEIDTISSDLNKLNDEVDALEKDLKEEQKKYDEQYEALKSRMVAQYKKGNTSYLDVLLNSSSLSDFISRYYIIEKAAEYDSKLLAQIEEQKNSIENSKKEVEKKQKEVSDKKAALKLEEIRLSNHKMNKNKIVSQLNAEQKKLQDEIDEANIERDKLDNELKEIARKAALANGGNNYSGGQLKCPVIYTRISSRFGYRGSAATGGVGSSYHRGIDLAAPKGTSIVAAESGTVIKVKTGCSHNGAGKCGCGGGYGNYVMVSHGSITTLYAHCTSIDVSTGQNVSAGQKIATVGSTGNSTGYHLHFSVILANGTYVDPAPYIGL